ncbi:MAG TPA: TonB-dependent receptor [Burkholderiaceae bacterium]
MIKETTLSHSLRLMFAGSMALGMTLASQAVLAQQVETVQVTGTRIKSPGVISNSPISSVGETEIKAAQPVAVEEFFKTLPSAVPAIGPGTNNGTGGGATINLRGLGTNRSLVLVNGRRFVPFNLNGAVDTNSIPIALISRVDLVTGGASAVYGADAVAGVANFNLKRNFTGFDLTTSYGTSGEKDAKRHRTDVTVGASLADGRGNVVLSLGKTKADPLKQGARAFGFRALSSTNGAASPTGTIVPAQVTIGAGPGGTTALAGDFQIDPATGTLRPVYQPYNFNPENYFVTGLERTQATSLATYKINNYAELYGEMFYTTSFVSSTLAPSGSFGNVYNVPIGNPYLPEAARQQICARQGITAANCVAGNTTLVPMTLGRRFTELGPRFSDFDNKTLQYTLGSKGDLAFDWTYDAYFSRGQADQAQLRKNWGSLSKLQQSLNAVSTTACINPANGCVPFNIFGAEGSITPAMLNFVNLTSILNQSVQQDVMSFSTSGDLGENIVSPWAKQAISLAIGLERRKVVAGTQSDSASQLTGEVLGTGAPTPDRVGTLVLKEVFGEAFIPVLRDIPFARSANLELGYRRTEFTTTKSQSYNTWKAGGDWEPIKGLRFRGMSQLATRAPNVNELYAPQVTSLANLSTDPCQGTRINTAESNTAGTLSNLCRLTGVPASVIGSLSAPSAGQANNFTGGNPLLNPEEAKTKTLGAVWEPLPRLAISLDYYEIKIEKAISAPSTTDVINDCYVVARNPSLAFNSACQGVQRSPQNGTLNGVSSPGIITVQSNQGKQSTSGFDFTVGYNMPLTTLGMDSKWGGLSFSLNANHIRTYLFQATPTAVNRDCLGFYSNACNSVQAAPVFRNKWTQRTNWTFGAFDFGYNWRHQGKTAVEPGSGTFLPQYSSIDAYNYVDLSAVWNFSKNVKLTLSVINAADKQPPVVGNTIGSTTANSGNTFPQTYDTVGRYFNFGASFKF